MTSAAGGSEFRTFFVKRQDCSICRAQKWGGGAVAFAGERTYMRTPGPMSLTLACLYPAQFSLGVYSMVRVVRLYSRACEGAKRSHDTAQADLRPR